MHDLLRQTPSRLNNPSHLRISNIRKIFFAIDCYHAYWYCTVYGARSIARALAAKPYLSFARSARCAILLVFSLCTVILKPVFFLVRKWHARNTRALPLFAIASVLSECECASARCSNKSKKKKKKSIFFFSCPIRTWHTPLCRCSGFAIDFYLRRLLIALLID